MRWAVTIGGLVAFVATTIAALYRDRFDTSRGAHQDSYSTRELGHRAFFEVLDAFGFDPVRIRSSDGLHTSRPLLFIEPTALEISLESRKLNLAQVIEERTKRGLQSVVVLSKWTSPPLGRGGVILAGSDVQLALLRALGFKNTDVNYNSHKKPNEPPTLWFRSPTSKLAIQIPYLQVLQGQDLYFASSSLGSLLARRKSVIVVSDTDLLHNFNLQRADHAKFWYALFRHGLKTQSVAIDEVFHGHGLERSLFKLLGRFPAVLLVLHVYLLVIIVLVIGFSRFGPPQVMPSELKRGPEEIIEVSASVLSTGRTVLQLSADYTLAILEDISSHLALSALDWQKRAQAIDDLAEKKGIEPQAKAMLAAYQHRDVDQGLDLKHARRAHDFRRRLLQTNLS